MAKQLDASALRMRPEDKYAEDQCRKHGVLGTGVSDEELIAKSPKLEREKLEGMSKAERHWLIHFKRHKFYRDQYLNNQSMTADKFQRYLPLFSHEEREKIFDEKERAGGNGAEWYKEISEEWERLCNPKYNLYVLGGPNNDEVVYIVPKTKRTLEVQMRGFGNKAARLMKNQDNPKIAKKVELEQAAISRTFLEELQKKTHKPITEDPQAKQTEEVIETLRKIRQAQEEAKASGKDLDFPIDAEEASTGLEDYTELFGGDIGFELEDD